MESPSEVAQVVGSPSEVGQAVGTVVHSHSGDPSEKHNNTEKKMLIVLANTLTVKVNSLQYRIRKKTKTRHHTNGVLEEWNEDVNL